MKLKQIRSAFISSWELAESFLCNRSEVVKSWECPKHFSVMIHSGSSNRCSPSNAVPEGHGPTIGVFSKAFCVSSKPVHAGVTCLHAILRRASVDDGCYCGKKMIPGCTPDERFCVGLMLMAACNGRNVLRTAVLLPPKKGRRRRQNQARQKPERVIADRAYDSDPLQARLQARGIELVCPKRKSRRSLQLSMDALCDAIASARKWSAR